MECIAGPPEVRAVPPAFRQHALPEHSRRGHQRKPKETLVEAERCEKTVRDYRLEAIDIYDHIDLKELKEGYLACITQLGI